MTTEGAKGRAGLTVSAFSSLSLSPPLVLVCIDNRSSALEVIREAGAFAVNILAEHQQNLSNHFASRLPNKFEGVECNSGAFGQPLLEGTVGGLECSVQNMVDAGDHVIVIGLVEEIAFDAPKRPLLYYSGQYRQLHEG